MPEKKPMRKRCIVCNELEEPKKLLQFLPNKFAHGLCIRPFQSFIRHVLNIDNPYDWQDMVWTDVNAPGCRVGLRAANGSGKTAVCAAPLAIANARIYDGSTTVVTSGVMRQVKEQFWPALNRLVIPFKDDWEIESTAAGMRLGNGSRIVGFTASDTFKFEGFHRTGRWDNLMVIVDEAKSIKDDIFDAIERMQPSRLLVQSSPGPAAGAFWRIWGPEKAFWTKHIVQAKDCPHLIKLKVKMEDGKMVSWMDSVIQKYGANAPLTKSMLFADWMSDEGELLICPLHWYDRCVEQAPNRAHGEMEMGADVAAGGDENVVALRHGNEIRIIDKWRDVDTYKAAVKVGALIKTTGVNPEKCNLDVGGLGVGFADVLANMGIHVNRVNFGGRPFDPDHYANRASEIWHTLAKKIEECSIILPPDDELRSQTTTRRYKITGSGKIQLESKQEMKARGLKSPDRADAVALAVAGGGDVSLGIATGTPGGSAMDKLLEAIGEVTQGEPLIGGIDTGRY